MAIGAETITPRSRNRKKAKKQKMGRKKKVTCSQEKERDQKGNNGRKERRKEMHLLGWVEFTLNDEWKRDLKWESKKN